MNAHKSPSIPEGYYTVTPFVIVKGAARFLDFMAEAFDAKELARVVGDDGEIGHAETRIGDSVVMAFDAKDGWPDTPAFLRLYVEDCERDVRAGPDGRRRPPSRNRPRCRGETGSRACEIPSATCGG